MIGDYHKTALVRGKSLIMAITGRKERLLYTSDLGIGHTVQFRLCNIMTKLNVIGKLFKTHVNLFKQAVILLESIILDLKGGITFEDLILKMRLKFALNLYVMVICII